MKIAIGGDHAGFHYKEKLKVFLADQGHVTLDFGPDSADSVDYPDYVHPACRAIEKGEADMGILICGSGNGVCMTANKHQGIRAALCWDRDLAKLARQHNNANVLCLSARFVAYELAESLVDTFLSTAFEGGRHEKRVGKISC
jgi:ribose 5-phosphate isomerase B